MKKSVHLIWEDGEYNYPSHGFKPSIHAYIHDDNLKRPGLVILPGGAYCKLSPNEAYPVVKRFYDLGWQCFVLTYTVNPLNEQPLYKQPLADVSRAFRYLRKNAEKFNIEDHHLVVCGFSAGGHAAASLTVRYLEDEDNNSKYKYYSNKPDAAILSYPVITSGKYSHKSSISNLIGENPNNDWLEWASLEKGVSNQTPPVFLWHTLVDETVPVENSFLFAESLKKHNILFSFMMFSTGKHGLSTADEIWQSCKYREAYVDEQRLLARDIVLENKDNLSDEYRKKFLEETDPLNENPETLSLTKEVNKEVVVWPNMANTWLKEVVFKN